VKRNKKLNNKKLREKKEGKKTGASSSCGKSPEVQSSGEKQ